MTATAKKLRKQAGLFGVIAGMRLSGKSTVAGTLKGRTLLLQAALLETGSNSAQKLAKRNGYELEVKDFESLPQLMDQIGNEGTSGKYDHLVIDSISAITTLKYNEAELQALVKKDNWAAFRQLAQVMQDFMLAAKKLTMTDGINVFMTLGLKPKFDALGNLIELDPDVKGNATIGTIQSLCPTVLYTRVSFDENNQPIRELITSPQGVYNGRIDTLLDDENPGTIDINKDGGLSKIIDLVRGE